MKMASQTLAARSFPAIEVSSLFDAVFRRAAHKIFSRVERGAVTLVEGDKKYAFGHDGSLAVTITIHDPAAYRALVLGGSLGAGEAYIKGSWSADDLAALARILVQNFPALEEAERGPARVVNAAREIISGARRNTRAGSRRNIAHHYDLSNAFFSLFLDESMMYSAAIFEQQDSTLEEAQRAKLDRICQKLALAPNDRVLEIGTGWGALAIYAAENYGCHVTTTTVSAEQHRLATERVRARGLADRVSVLLRDYRDLDGTFDKLVSVEMIEAVGHEFLDQYFRACSDRLTPSGAMLLQAITISDQHQRAHRASIDFIKEYIFPGSCIPSVTTILDSTTRATDLRLFQHEDLTPHYARTLRIWRERFLAQKSRVNALGFDDAFIRMWEYYLAYCEGGFEERYLGSVQMVFTKPAARLAPILPSLAMTTTAPPLEGAREKLRNAS